MSEKLKVSVLFRSNLFQLADCFRARVPLSPFSPKIMINTLASVPAPRGTQDKGHDTGLSDMQPFFSGLDSGILGRARSAEKQVQSC